MIETTVAGEVLGLLPEKAIYWAREKMLLVADTHFGKTATFRAAGIAVPEGGTEDDLAKLDRILDETGARELLVLGDFFHATGGRTAELHGALAAWRSWRSELLITLVPGNHDRSAGLPPEEWDIAIPGNEMLRGPFLFRHVPEKRSEGYVLAGHLHPALRIADGRMGSEKIPCFHFGERVGVLPAFGSFTGTHGIDGKPGDRVFAVTEGSVLEIPGGLLAR